MARIGAKKTITWYNVRIDDCRDGDYFVGLRYIGEKFC